MSMFIRVVSWLSGAAVAVAVANAPASAIAEDQPAAVIAALARADALRERIIDYQRNGDTWRPEITEMLLTLGRTLQQLGDHTSALAELERAVHLTRVNHGLFSPQQLPAVALQVESHLALQDWEQADALQQYMFLVESRAYPELGPDQIPTLERFVRWNFNAYEQRQGAYPAARLIDAYHLLSAILTIVDSQPNPDAYPRETYLQQMAYIAWMMHLTGVQTRVEAQMTHVRWIEDGWVERTTDNQYQYRRNPHLQGLRALEEIVALRERDLAAVTAEYPRYWELRRRHTDALLSLADWQLMFDRRQGAVSQYQMAWESMMDAPDGLQRRVFERIVVLPAYRESLRSRTATESQDQVAVFAPADDAVWQRPDLGAYPSMLIQFDINRFGRTGRVSVLEENEEMDERERRQLVNSLRNNLLRPIIRDGDLVHANELVYRFAYMIESHLRQGQ